MTSVVAALSRATYELLVALIRNFYLYSSIFDDFLKMTPLSLWCTVGDYSARNRWSTVTALCLTLTRMTALPTASFTFILLHLQKNIYFVENCLYNVDIGIYLTRISISENAGASVIYIAYIHA